MATFPIAPTYAPPFERNAKGEETIAPVWLQWFLDVARVFTLLGAGGITAANHNSLTGLQGGLAGGSGQFYHLTAAQLATLISGPGTAESGISIGASPSVYTNTSGFTQMLIVTGGGGLTFQYSRDNVTYYGLPTTSGQYIIGRGDHFKIAYGVAPTVTAFDL